MRISLIIVTIVLIYGTFSTIFHDTTLVGDYGKRLGEINIDMFGYLAYIIPPALFYPIYKLYKNPKLILQPELYMGWIMLALSLIILQGLVLSGEKSGILGREFYTALFPLIGKAGLWLFWLATIILATVLILDEIPTIEEIEVHIANILSKFKKRETNKPDRTGLDLQEERLLPTGWWGKILYIINPRYKKEMQEILDMELDPIDIAQKRDKNYIKEFELKKYEQSLSNSISYEEEMINSINRTKTLQKKQEEYDDFFDIPTPKDITKAQNSTKIETENFDKNNYTDQFEIEIEDDFIPKQPKSKTETLKDNTNSIVEVLSKEESKTKSIKKEIHKVALVEELEENKKLMEGLEKGKIQKPTNFKLPALDFLQKPPKGKRRVNEFEIDRKIGELLDKLARFKIEGDVVRTYSGPLVTTFEFKPAPNIKVSKIINLQDDLAMALKAETIRIQAPIPGRDVVGIEIPNDEFDTIYLRDILQSETFQNSKSPLTVALGKDIVGKPFITDLKKLPHLLIAGTTGSGKSVGINAMLLSLLYRNDPDSLKLVLIDPKMLEFSTYNDIPHLLTPVIVEPKKAIAALANMVSEMERRYRMLSEAKVKNIDNYNAKMQREGGNKLPYIVVVIDELADLMMNGGKEVEYSIARLAQMARAAGIHLIVATQRPSVDVVTGLIKANLPSRLSYRVGQKIDSKVILDQMGAESLLGRGDALFTPPNAIGVVRIHAPWNSEEEIERVVEFLKAQREPEYDENFFTEEDNQKDGSTPNSINGIELDPLYEKAKEVVLTDKKTSISYLQRKLQIGYNRSANIVDQLEKMGVLSPPNHKGNREILL